MYVSFLYVCCYNDIIIKTIKQYYCVVLMQTPRVMVIQQTALIHIGRTFTWRLVRIKAVWILYRYESIIKAKLMFLHLIQYRRL